MNLHIRHMYAGIVTYRKVILAFAAVFLMFLPLALINNGGVRDTSSEAGTGSYGGTSISPENECIRCHNGNITSMGADREKCGVCHSDAHGVDSPPKTYEDSGKDTIHLKHSRPVNNQQSCTACHGSPSCQMCHGSHQGIKDANVSKDCKSCHGGLPEPTGHSEKSYLFRKSMHGWMGRCDTCHSGDRLRFGNLATYDRSNSSLLCSNCHSEQYKDPKHYTVSPEGIEKNRCVDCHDPHVSSEPRYALEIPSTVKETVYDAAGALKSNFAILAIGGIFILSILTEYIFRPKKGHIILSRTLKVEHEKSKARAIKISSSVPPDAESLSGIAGILNRNNAGLLGMSAGNNEIIIFISRNNGLTDEDKLIRELGALGWVTEAKYSEDYEIS